MNQTHAQGERPPFAQRLAVLRKACRLSQSRLAKAAGVAVSTVERWESGKTVPRLSELYAVLCALNANPHEANDLRNALRTDAPHTRRVGLPMPKADAPRPVLPVDSPVPDSATGALLRALRLRRGQAQSVVASAIGVTQSTLARWECGDSWPDPTRLHTICHYLNASPDEIAHLTCARFAQDLPESLFDETPPVSAEGVAYLLERVPYHGDLYDLYYTAIVAWLSSQTRGTTPQTRSWRGYTRATPCACPTTDGFTKPRRSPAGPCDLRGGQATRSRFALTFWHEWRRRKARCMTRASGFTNGANAPCR